MKALVFVLALLAGMPALALAGARDISSREAKALIEKNKAIYLLDVRTQQENSQARLSGSVLIPIDQFERRAGEVPKNRPVLVYCAVGSRSKPVAEFLSQRGYREVYNMTDGIVGWYRNGYPIQR